MNLMNDIDLNTAKVSKCEIKLFTIKVYLK